MWHTGNLKVEIKMTLHWGIGYKNDCEMRVDKDCVGPCNIDLTNK